jgi:hypothetical protein
MESRYAGWYCPLRDQWYQYLSTRPRRNIENMYKVWVRLIPSAEQHKIYIIENGTVEEVNIDFWSFRGTARHIFCNRAHLHDSLIIEASESREVLPTNALIHR